MWHTRPFVRSTQGCSAPPPPVSLRGACDAAFPTALQRDGRTALHLAVMNDRLAAVKCLLSHGVSPSIVVADGEWRGWTPLHLAAYFDCTSVVHALVTRGVDVNAREV